MTAPSSYTPTDSGWGVQFVAAVLLGLVILGVVRVVVVLVGRHVRSRSRHPLAPPRPIRLRQGGWR